jgi:ribonuclease P protein component
LVIPNQLPFSRFGVSASGRLGNAVRRNKAKRRFKEVIRTSLPLVQGGWDCFLILRQPAAAASFDEIEQAVNLLFGRAGLWQR